MGSPDSALPDGELAFTEQESPGGADEDEHRAWSRIGLPDSSLMDAGRPSTTLLPARHGQLGEWARKLVMIFYFLFFCFFVFLSFRVESYWVPLGKGLEKKL